MSTELKQNTPQWYAARVGRVTASRVGALLGHSPFQSANACIKDMVLEATGNREDFDNPAMRWGRENETKAAHIYEFLYAGAEPVTETGFWVADIEDVPVGASPDRLVGNEGLVEIKCPYSLRDEENPEALFKPITDQKHYYHQIQMQLYCTGRKWCDFFQWTPNGHKHERVYVDDRWLERITDSLRDAYTAYKGALDKVDDTAVLGSSSRWAAACEDYKLAKSMADKAQESLDMAKARLIGMCEEAELPHCEGSGVKVTRVDRKGTVDWKKMAVEQLTSDVVQDIEEDYRKAGGSSWRVTGE